MCEIPKPTEKMAVSIGGQNFEYMRTEKVFYVDKTHFIKEWWEEKDVVTLITRPRRFGKTLNLSMMECFFSAGYAGRDDLFEGLSIWEDGSYRKLQGTFPVISISFAGVKAKSFQGARDGIINAIANAYEAHSYLKNSQVLTEQEKSSFDAFQNYSVNPSEKKRISDSLVVVALNKLSMYLERYYHAKALIFLDEYDTPVQESYVSGYWQELIDFVRELFNLTFKTNEYFQRALLTGITRVSRESVFSDLNNLNVITTTTNKYCTSFGFTEEEVFEALKERNLSNMMDHIKFWYDGFIFGSRKDIYNPWSITMYLDTQEFGTYWADTSSNALVSELIKTGTPELKMQMEVLLADDFLETELDEKVIFDQLRKKRGAIWSLLIASGYLRPEERLFDPARGKHIYRLKLTNHEVRLMFQDMIAAWFPEDETSYQNFKEALLTGDLDYMNQYMNETAAEVFSSFDTGRKFSEKTHPERFYHGFVLGLIVDLAGRYQIRSNRESGLGRYDVMLEPLHREDDAIVMEFKVFSKQKDKTLENAVENALEQIKQKKYDTELIARGIHENRIRHYGFAFDGKKILIGEADVCSPRNRR